MIKQIRKVGNSNALVLDKPLLELLGLAEGSHVQLTVQDGVLIVAPVHPATEQKAFESAVEEVLQKRKVVLRRLAQ